MTCTTGKSICRDGARKLAFYKKNNQKEKKKAGGKAGFCRTTWAHQNWGGMGELNAKVSESKKRTRPAHPARSQLLIISS